MNKAHLVYLLKVYPCYIIVFLFKNHPNIIQRFLLRRLVQYLHANNRYYGNLLSKTILDSHEDIYKTIPLLDKGIIRSNLSDITSSTVNPEKVEWANTGGSTGEPLRFPRLVSKIPFEDIHQLYLYKQMGWNYGDIIISIDGSRIAENELAKRHYWKEGKNFPYGRYSLSTMYMSNETLPYYIDFIQVVKPCVLRGYPSGLKMLCTYIKENSIKLNFRPKGIYLTSEYASEEDRTFISNVLCCDVWGQYGHTEVSAFAISKPGDERYLCSPFYGITEILDESDQHVKIGEQGEIVVTGFSNLGLPFVRYKTGDLAIYGGIKNGWVILNRLLGRTVDYIVNKNNEQIFLTGFIFGGHLAAFNAIADWQIRQDKAGFVDITIVRTTDWKCDYDQDMLFLFQNQGITASINYAESIARSKRGKRIFMIQNIK